MEEFKPNLENNIEKFKKAEVNLFIKGALSEFQGFGNYIATYGEKELLENNKEELQVILDDIGTWDKIVGNEGNVSTGFIKQKSNKLYFGENYPQFTKFPQEYRNYRQTAYSIIDYNDPNIGNAGKIFSALKPFKEYNKKEIGKDKTEVIYDNSEIEIPIALKESLLEVFNSSDNDKKLIINAIVEPGEELLGDNAVNHPIVKKVLFFLDTLTKEQRKNFSLFFGDPQQWNIYNDSKVIILFKGFGESSERQKKHEEYYISKGAVIKNWEDFTK